MTRQFTANQHTYKQRITPHAAAKIVTNLTLQGHYHTAIAQAAGIHIKTLHRLKRGQVQHISPDTLARIQQAAAKMSPGGELADTVATVPTWRATRRVNALRAAGYTLDDIADGAGISYNGVKDISTGKYTFTDRDKFLNVDKLYRRAEGQPVRRPSKQAIKARWKVPLAWDDIDNPDESPYTEDDPTPADDERIPLTDEHLQVLEELADTFGGLAPLARYLHTTGPNLSNIRKRKCQTITYGLARQMADLQEDIWLRAVNIDRLRPTSDYVD